MFWLSEWKDRVKIEPRNFGQTLQHALTNELDTKYANRIVHGVGLCIAVHDLMDASDGLVYHSDGCTYYTVTLRMIVFRPFAGEVLVGRVRSCSPEGVRVSLGFFEDILIPPHLMHEDCEFDTNEQLWVWKWDGNDMYMDVDEPIRIRVHNYEFNHVQPSTTLQHTRRRSVVVGIDAEPTPTETKVAPFALTASIIGPGMGLLSWWK
jgi:DNA-directed RNA polymerase III subunit RPC8